jgi:hypothetical protein
MLWAVRESVKGLDGTCVGKLPQGVVAGDRSSRDDRECAGLCVGSASDGRSTSGVRNWPLRQRHSGAGRSAEREYSQKRKGDEAPVHTQQIIRHGLAQMAREQVLLRSVSRICWYTRQASSTNPTIVKSRPAVRMGWARDSRRSHSNKWGLTCVFLSGGCPLNVLKIHDYDPRNSSVRISFVTVSSAGLGVRARGRLPRDVDRRQWMVSLAIRLCRRHSEGDQIPIRRRM